MIGEGVRECSYVLVGTKGSGEVDLLGWGREGKGEEKKKDEEMCEVTMIGCHYYCSTWIDAGDTGREEKWAIFVHLYKSGTCIQTRGNMILEYIPQKSAYARRITHAEVKA